MFGTAPRGPAIQPRMLRRAVRSAAVPAKVPAAPRLRAVIDPTRAMAKAPAKARPRAKAPAQKSTTTSIGEPLARGVFHLWDVDPTSAHDVTVHSATAPIRITALNGAGCLLADAVATRGKSVAPAGASSVIVGEAPNPRVVGWEIGTLLLRVNVGTLLAPGATIHLSRPWVPPARSGAPLANGTPRWIKAALVTAEVDAIVTRFPLAHGSTPRTIVVRLDRIDAGAKIDEVKVECEGAAIRESQTVQSARGWTSSIPCACPGVEPPPRMPPYRSGWRRGPIGD